MRITIWRVVSMASFCPHIAPGTRQVAACFRIEFVVVCFVLFCFVQAGPATSTYGHVAHVPGAGGAQPAITAHTLGCYKAPCARLQPIRIQEASAGPNRAIRPVQVAHRQPLYAPGTPRVPKGTHGYRSRAARTCTSGPRPSGQTTGYGCGNAHPTKPVCWKLPRAPPLVGALPAGIARWSNGYGSSNETRAYQSLGDGEGRREGSGQNGQGCNCSFYYKPVGQARGASIRLGSDWDMPQSARGCRPGWCGGDRRKQGRCTGSASE